MVWLPRNKKQTYRSESRPQMWPSDFTLVVTLTLNFQGQIWNLLYLSQKWSDCCKTKSKNIDWTQGLKCDHRVWPWPWPWPWIFKVNYGICCISTKSGLIATKRKAKVKSDYHIWGLEFNRCVCFSFCGNRTIFGRDIGNSIFDLENSRSRSNPMVTFEVLRSIDMFAFRFVAIGPFLAEI